MYLILLEIPHSLISNVQTTNALSTYCLNNVWSKSQQPQNFENNFGYNWARASTVA